VAPAPPQRIRACRARAARPAARRALGSGRRASKSSRRARSAPCSASAPHATPMGRGRTQLQAEQWSDSRCSGPGGRLAAARPPCRSSSTGLARLSLCPLASLCSHCRAAGARFARQGGGGASTSPAPGSAPTGCAPNGGQRTPQSSGTSGPAGGRGTSALAAFSCACARPPSPPQRLRCGLPARPVAQSRQIPA